MFYKLWRKAAISFTSILVTVVLGNSASAEMYLNFDTKLKYDSNITNAKFLSDIVGDAQIVANVNSGYYFQLSDFNSLRIQAELGGEAYNTYH
jgi:hypothetical protein